MSDEIKVTGSVNLVEVVANLNHAVKEMERLGEYVRDEGKDNRRRFDEVKTEVVACKSELKGEISAVVLAQKLTDKDVRMFVGKLSAVVSAATAVAGWLLKSGIIAVVL